MTDKKLSQLSLGTAIAQADLWYSDQGGSSVAQKSSAVHNFVRPESIDGMNPIYNVVAGTVSGAQRLANVAGINSAIADACANGCEYVDLFVPGAIQVDGTLNLFDTTTPAGATTRAPKLRGMRFLTRVEEWNASGGIDTIHIGPPVGNASGQGSYGGGIINLWVVSITDQSTITPLTGHLGAQISITSCEQCELSGLAIGEISTPVASTTHFAYNAISQDPASGPFSCTFHDIEIKGFGHNGLDAAQTTSGSVFWNIMIRNGGLGEPSLKTSTGSALIVGNGEGVFDQINVEWSIFQASTAPAIFIPSSAGVRFGHLHMEGLQLASAFSTRGAFILPGGAGIARFESIHMISTNLPTGCNITSAALFGFGFGGNYMNVSVGQSLVAQTLALGTGVNWYFANTYEGPGAGATTNCKIDFNGPCLMFGDGSFSAKFTKWSDCNFTANSQGPANGLGIPPSNFAGNSILTVTTSAYGYSAGTFTASMLDGNDTYAWNAGVNGTIVLPLTVMDALLPVTLQPYPGTEREIVNIDTHTCAVHDSAGTNLLTAASLTTGQFVRLRFDGAAWQQINSGTRL